MELLLLLLEVVTVENGLSVTNPGLGSPPDLATEAVVASEFIEEEELGSSRLWPSKGPIQQRRTGKKTTP